MRTFILTLLVTVTPLLSASGQERAIGTATMVGTVFVADPAGNQSFLPGAKVELSGPVSVTTESDEKGEYSFASIPAGKYTVQGFSPGLQAVKIIYVEAGETVEAPLELKIVAVETSVKVTASSTEAIQPAASGTINESTLRDAPNVNERFESSLPLIPGVVRGPDGRVNLKGTRGTQSGELVNSANVTDPVTGGPAINLPIDVVQSVEVISNPYDPQYGKFTGAVSTVETKTGNYDGYHFSIQNFFPRLRDRDGHILYQKGTRTCAACYIVAGSSVPPSVPRALRLMPATCPATCRSARPARSSPRNFTWPSASVAPSST